MLFNLIKAVAISLITLLLYKKVLHLFIKIAGGNANGGASDTRE